MLESGSVSSLILLLLLLSFDIDRDAKSGTGSGTMGVAEEEDEEEDEVGKRCDRISKAIIFSSASSQISRTREGSNGGLNLLISSTISKLCIFYSS